MKRTNTKSGLKAQSMPAQAICPRCGAPLPGGEWGEYCPKCVARVSLRPTLLGRSRKVAASRNRPNGTAEDGANRELTDKSGIPGALLRRFGDYELLEVIARGGMGTVWRARQISLGRLVALKLLRAAEFARPEDEERFRSEAAAAASLQHPHIVALHDFGKHEGQPWFSMDFVEGQTLADLVRDQPLSPKNAAELLQTVAEAIAYAHSRGILHRDLKPSNILLDHAGQPRITDFGLAKRFGVPASAGAASRRSQELADSAPCTAHSALTLSGQLLGTPNYAPPEQLAVRRGEVGPHSDVYGLGAVLYEMLTGRPPFVADSVEATLLQVIDAEPVPPRTLNSAVPVDLETICLKCLEKEPARRYPTAQALADDFGRFLRDEPIVARPVGAFGQFRRWCKRKPGWATASALAVVFLATVVVFLAIVPGRLAEKRRRAAAAASSLLSVPVILQNATATFSQSGFPIRDAIDGNTSTGGWAILDPSSKDDPTSPQIAVFETASNVGFPDGSVLMFKLTQNAGSQHLLGRFRLSVTRDDRGTFADGLAGGGDVTATWIILDPDFFSAVSGATLTKLDDFSILATGELPNVDTYTITAHTALTNITGVRLEALAHPGLPGDGPGCHEPDGNFILTEFELEVSLASAMSMRMPATGSDGVAPQQTLKFVDTEFPESNWELYAISQPASIRASRAQVTEGFAPSRVFQRVSHFLGGTEAPLEMLSIQLNRQAIYFPATNGAIAFIEYSADCRTFATEFNTFGGFFAPALQQNGKVYVANKFFRPARDDYSSTRLPSHWKEIRFSRLSQADFRLATKPTAYHATQHPDFSASGAPIVFGYAAGNTHTGTNEVTRQIDIDNWSVAIYSRSPAPAQ